MKINHFIIGASNVSSSTDFYCKLFGFILTDDDPGEKEGSVLDGNGCELLILPFEAHKLPNPFHFAFEVEDLKEFELILGKSKEMGLKPRSMPARNSPPGFTEFERAGIKYKNFYVFDPSNSILEVMVRI